MNPVFVSERHGYEDDNEKGGRIPFISLSLFLCLRLFSFLSLKRNIDGQLKRGSLVRERDCIINRGGLSEEVKQDRGFEIVNDQRGGAFLAAD